MRKKTKICLTELFKSETDPLGSYTGNCDDGEPTQDADDL